MILICRHDAYQPIIHIAIVVRLLGLLLWPPTLIKLLHVSDLVSHNLVYCLQVNFRYQSYILVIVGQVINARHLAAILEDIPGECWQLSILLAQPGHICPEIFIVSVSCNTM